MDSNQKVEIAGLLLSSAIFDLFSKLPPDLSRGEKFEAILMGLGITGGVLIGQSPLHWIEQIEALQRMHGYALTEGLLQVHKDKREGKE